MPWNRFANNLRTTWELGDLKKAGYLWTPVDFMKFVEFHKRRNKQGILYLLLNLFQICISENVERKGQNINWQGNYKDNNGKRKYGNSKSKQDTKDGDDGREDENKKGKGNNQQSSPVNKTPGCMKKNASRTKKK